MGLKKLDLYLRWKGAELTKPKSNYPDQAFKEYYEK